MNIQVEHLNSRAKRAVERQIAGGAPHYVRARHLRGLLPLAPEDFSATDAPTAQRILFRLADALRAERRRGRMGHWTYDLNRHIALAQAYRAEKAALAACTLDTTCESQD